MLGCLLLAAAPALAQEAPPVVTSDSRLPGLLSERAVLTRRYAEASEQRHSLFGNKASKKDLQDVVDALQGIVDKDQQIVDVLNQTAQAAQTTAQQAQSTAERLATTTTHLETSSRDDRNLTVQRLTELQNEMANLRQREKQRIVRERDLAAEVTEVHRGRVTRDVLIAGLALLCVGLTVAWRRRK